MNNTEEDYKWNQEKYEMIIQKGMQIIDSIIAMSNKNVTIEGDKHFSEFFITLQELAWTTQNVFKSTSTHPMDMLGIFGLENFLMNTLEHNLKISDISLYNPGKAIEVMR